MWRSDGLAANSEESRQALFDIIRRAPKTVNDGPALTVDQHALSQQLRRLLTVGFVTVGACGARRLPPDPGPPDRD